MQTELHELMATKDVIVLTSLEVPAVSWLIDGYQENADTQNRERTPIRHRSDCVAMSKWP